MVMPRSSLTIRLGFIGILLMNLLFGLLATYIGGYAKALEHIYHFNAMTLSSFSANFYAGLTLGTIPAGILIDKYGPGKISVFAILIVVISLIIFHFSNSAAYFNISRFIMGLGFSCSFPCGQKVIKINSSKRLLPWHAGIFLSVYSLGAVLSIIGVVPLTQTFGIADSSLSILLLSILILIYLYIFSDVNDYNANSRLNSIRSISRENFIIFFNSRFILITISNAFISIFSMVFLSSWSLTYLNTMYANNGIINDYSISATYIMLSISSALFGRIYYKYLPPLQWMLLQCCCVFIGFSFLILLPTTWLHLWVVISIFVICAVFVGGNTVFSITYLLNFFPDKFSGSLSALYLTLLRVIVYATTQLNAWLIYYHNKLSFNYTLNDYDVALIFILFLFSVSVFFMLGLSIYDKSND